MGSHFGAASMGAIDLWRYQLGSWELDLRYYRKDGRIGPRDELLDVRAQLGRGTRRLARSLRRRGVLAAPAPRADAGSSAAERLTRLTGADSRVEPPLSVFARLSQSAQSVVARSSARRQPALQSNAARPLAGTGLCGKAAFIGAVSADLLLTQLPQWYSAMMAEMEERREAERQAEAEEQAAAELAHRAEHPDFLHPPMLAAAYRDAAITETARSHVYDRLPIRIASGALGCGVLGALVARSAAGMRTLSRVGPLRFGCGVIAGGAALGAAVDATVRAGYEDVFREAGEEPCRESGMIAGFRLAPNKTFILFAGMLGGYPASATFFNAYCSGATAARAERSATPLQVWPFVELLIDPEDLEARHKEAVAAELWVQEDEAALTDEIVSARERRVASTIEDGGGWSEEQLGQFLTNIGICQLG